MNTFYDSLATEYSAAVGQESREDGARAFIRKLRTRHPFESLLDVACGTGLFSLAAHAEGVGDVHGVDLSGEMLAGARRQAGRRQAGVRFGCMSMDDLHPIEDSTVDAVVCMGNSLPHLIGEGQMARTFGEFARVVRKGGALALHLLNYQLVLERQERIVGITRNEHLEYVRFYDFLDRTLSFNLLRIDWGKEPPETTIQSTELRPFHGAEITAELHSCGFRNIELYGGLDFSPFDPSDSDVLLVVAT